ncbi:MAG: FecR domain-containing protein [Chitinispirillaceae bacterium]
MKKHHLSFLVVFTIVLTGSIIARTVKSDEQFITRTVAKGESVSLICLELYGYYSDELGDAFLKDNPQVKDIDVIAAGQKLKFRKPRETEEKTAEKTVQTDVLFVKKVRAVQGVVTLIEGDVSIQKVKDDSAIPLTVNTTVTPGDKIITGTDGKAELIINRESVVRLKENTRMTVEDFRDENRGSKKTRLDCGSGTIWSKVKKFKDKMCRFELSLPTAVAGVHGTVYQVSVDPEDKSEVRVYTGEVAVSDKPSEQSSENGVQEESGPSEVQGPTEVSMETWVHVVRSMSKISISKDGKAGETVSFSKNPGNEWEKWNEKRDSRIAHIFSED